MNTCKKLLCFLLALVCCMGVLVACKDETDTEKETLPPRDVETQGEDVDPSIRNDLTGNYDFGKKEYKILSRSETAYEFTNEAGMGGTPLEKAIYERNEYVMERCNVVITVDATTRGDWWNRTQFMTLVRNNAQENSSDYALVATHSSYLSVLAIEGLAYDLTELPNINLEKRWWNKQYYDAANYNGAVYSMLGDIAYSLYEYLMVIFYNEEIAEDHDITGLYDTVLDGDWTFGQLKTYVTMVTTDLNLEDTLYGFLVNGHGNHAYLGAFDVDVMPLVDDRHTVSLEITEELFNPINAVVEFVQNTPQVRKDYQHENSIGVQNPLFVAGRSLFYEQMLGQAMYFKEDMKADYGVLPYPKYNENQVDYHTDYCDDLTGVMVPRNIKNADMVGTVTEMLCMESYTTVVEQFYNVNLKYHAFNDPLCVETLEIIRTSLSPSFAKIYTSSLEYPTSTIGNIIEHNFEIASYWAEHASAWKPALDALYEKLDRLGAIE